MTNINPLTLSEANTAAIFNLYLYIAHHSSPSEDETFKSIINSLDYEHINKPANWQKTDISRLKILKNFVANNNIISNSKLIKLTQIKNGLTACAFQLPDSKIHIAFKGTGSSEWIDNGEGLAGNKVATNQQIEALIWFYKTIKENNWNHNNRIIISGHSKGGNKAQFISIHSDFPDVCFSFSGQGFSPEAITTFKNIRGDKYNSRRSKIYSISADNDYVNVLGERLAPNSNILYFEPTAGLHGIESILDANGSFTPQKEQGILSRYIEEVSHDLMNIKPFARQYATIGVMSIFQKYLGDGTSLNGDEISLQNTIAGISQIIKAILPNTLST